MAIGRVSQPFPRPKRSVRLSTHSAFQLGRTTLVGQISLNDRKAHQQFNCPHLLSSLHLLTIILFSLPWRTFTLSGPLPPGLWLLRRLRPPGRALAFSRPTTWVVRPGSSPVPPPETYERPVAACSTPDGLETAPAGNPTPPARRLPFLGQVYQPLAPVVTDDAYAGSSASA